MKYLILGASAAGISAAKTIRSLDKEGEICIVSEDENIHSRCMLHLLISGHRDIDGLDFSDKNFFSDKSINWIKGKKAVSLNTEDKTVTLNDSTVLSYEKLLIATGASSFIPPIKGIYGSKGVYGLRDAKDAQAIRDLSEKISSAAVIGAGLVGIDAVVGLSEKNIKLHLVEMSDRILPMQLDSRAAQKYQEALMKKGTDIYLNSSVTEVETDADGNVTAIVLNNGEKLECQMIIVAAGVRPNLSFVGDTSLKIDRGIVINEQCETTVKDIYAAGDVTYISPVWPVAVKQGITAGHNMAGVLKKLDALYGAQNSMNFMGINTVSTGLIYPPDDTYQVEIQDSGNSYKKIIHKDGIIFGAIMQGDIAYSGALFQVIKKKINISDAGKGIFDINYASYLI